jgi:hypothetical protein
MGCIYSQAVAPQQGIRRFSGCWGHRTTHHQFIHLPLPASAQLGAALEILSIGFCCRFGYSAWASLLAGGSCAVSTRAGRILGHVGGWTYLDSRHHRFGLVLRSSRLHGRAHATSALPGLALWSRCCLVALFGWGGCVDTTISRVLVPYIRHVKLLCAFVSVPVRQLRSAVCLAVMKWPNAAYCANRSNENVARAWEAAG